MRTAMALQLKSVLGFNWNDEEAEIILIQEGSAGGGWPAVLPLLPPWPRNTIRLT